MDASTISADTFSLVSLWTNADWVIKGVMVGLALASLAVKLREGLVASGSALLALWTTAALPLVLGLSLLLAATLTAFRRLMQPAHVKAVS